MPQEMGTKGPDRSWSGLFIAIVCIIFILLTVAMCIVYLSKVEMMDKVTGKR